MPKRTYKILRFDGGINNDADPRDIGDNQFAELQNVAVDEMGKIIALGNIQTTQNHGADITMTGILTGHGKGLFACTTDHDGLLDGTVEVPGQTYYLVENGGTINGIGEDGETPSPTLDCTIGSAGPTMYYVDGALRIADADHGGGTTPVWRGYIPGKTYFANTPTADAVIAEAWYTANAEVAGCFPTYVPTAGDDTNTYGLSICKNAMMLNVLDGGQYSFTHSLCETNDDGWDGSTDSYTGNSGIHWGVAIAFDEDDGGNGSGTWMPQTTVRYKFFITTMYDNHTQESLPQLMRMWDSDQVFDTALINDDIKAEIYFTDGDTAWASSEGENVAVRFTLDMKIGKDGTTNYNFGASDIIHEGGVGEEGNPRISGIRIYWSSNEDGHTSLWQMYDAKFDEGVKAIGPDGGGGGTSGYSPFVASSTYGAGHGTASVPIKWTNPPRYFQYDVLNGHAPTDVIKVDSYKTAVVANRRVYIGNIKQDGIIHGDRMLKSPVNQFDKFPSINNIDVATHDGDDIVALIEYADRILQFKNNTCYIINISGNSEYLEAEHKFKGISNPGAVCRTDYGVAWANSNGCYLYDGQVVTDLLEAQGMRKINQSTWSDFIGTTHYHRIGFNPFKRQLVILEGGTGVTAYVYDMITKSWTYASAMVADTDTKSNFINDPVDGSLLIFDNGSNTVDKWTDSPSTATPTIIITTKDIDFGEPAVRKKVYKVYITYRSNSTTLPTVYYDTDGNTTLTTAATATTGFTNTSNQWTRAEFRFGSDANSCKSIQLKISGSAHTSFEINDISFIFRQKSTK